MPRGGKRVLIVDDQASIRQTMVGIIEELAYEVEGAEDGYQAIDQIKKEPFALIFVDIKMPGINGVQTFREIKKTRPHSLVVMMTGYEVEDLISAAMSEGALAVMYKPIEPERVVRLLESVCGGRARSLPPAVDSFVNKCRCIFSDVALKCPISRISLRVADGELHALRLVTSVGPTAEQAPALASVSSLGGSAFLRSSTVAVNDYVAYPSALDTDVALGMKSSLAIPFRSSTGQVLGSLIVGANEPDYFNQPRVDAFSNIVEEIERLIAGSEIGEPELLRYLNGLGLSTEQILV